MKYIKENYWQWGLFSKSTRENFWRWLAFKLPSALVLIYDYLDY